MTISLFKSLVRKVRDKFLPRVPLVAKCADGSVPYYRNDLVAHKLWSGQGYEERERELLRRLMPHQRCFVDVGANIGLFTLLASRRLGRDGRVFAFEASPHEYRKLGQTIRWNALENVVATNMAVSEADGELVMYQNTEGAGALNRIGSPANDKLSWDPVTVPATSLDNFFVDGRTDAIDMIKVDVEGHELPVFRGAERVIERYRPCFMVEMNDARATETSKPLEVWDFLVARGYHWFSISDDAKTLRELAQVPTFGYVNLIAVHQSRVDEINAVLQAD